MDHKTNISSKNTAKPSKLLTIIALFIAVSLPFFLVKNFRHKQNNYTNQAVLLPQPASQKADVDEPQDNQWQTVITRSGDTLAAIFKRAGISPKVLHTILDHNPHAKILTGIKPNQKLQLLISNDILEKLIIPVSATQLLTVYHEDGNYRTELKSRKTESHNQYVTATVKGSLYGTAKRMNIPYKLIQQMTDIFNWEIDFSRDVRVGDQFTIIYKADFIDNNMVNTGEIIAVSYTSRGKSHQATRYVFANGDYDYFTPQGVSLKKAFDRYPIRFSHISSTFSLSRKHPVLHYNRPHKGIDLAASIGTPIHATGDGRVEIIGRHNGYGNMVKIAHSNNFSSVYGHMLKFQKGLSKGSRVKRGQIIGYVGQSGLATGPHCHYEFHINNTPRNPTTIDLPKSSPISTKELASFKARSGTLFAQMKLYEDAYLTASLKKSQDVG